MADPRSIYTISDDVASELASSPRPVLVHMVNGFVDAGAAAEVACEHLTGRFESRRLATFDVDQLIDYRARRPTMTFDSSTWSYYEEPHLAVDLMRDAAGVPFLLLHGLEPDVQWERFAAAVRQLVERFGVRMTVGLSGIPMAVPHSRPLGVTAHGTSGDIAERGWFGTVQVPASVGALLEYRLGGWGHDAVGFAVHVPHYVAQSTYPEAAMVALRRVERATGLDLDVAELEPAARDARREVERQVDGSAEIAAVVAALEEEYDSFARATGTTSLLPEAAQIPSADELAAEFERFLAQQSGS